jgi:hypothetical protein
MFSAPTSTAPALSSRRTSSASRAAGAAVALDLRARQRGQAGHVEQVLHRERHAGQRHARAALVPVDQRGALQRPLGQHRGEGVDHAARWRRCDASAACTASTARAAGSPGAHPLIGTWAGAIRAARQVPRPPDRQEHAARLVGRRAAAGHHLLGHLRRQRVQVAQHAGRLLGGDVAGPAAAAAASRPPSFIGRGLARAQALLSCR